MYAPPGAADNVYCGINVPPALIDTVPLSVDIKYSAALVIAPVKTKLETEVITIDCGPLPVPNVEFDAILKNPFAKKLFMVAVPPNPTPIV